MRVFFISLFLLLIIAVQGGTVEATYPDVSSSPKAMTLIGRWRVRFVLVGGIEKNLVFEAGTKGSGSFLLLDTGPDDQPATFPLPAAWSLLTNDRVSFSDEVELPIGTCCREIGTLMFKGRFASSNSISGKLVFVTSLDEEESPYKLRSMVGTFTAARVFAN